MPDGHYEYLVMLFGLTNSPGASASCKGREMRFHSSSVSFLGHIAGKGTVAMDPEKVSAVCDWPILESRQQLQRFIGFTNFYRRFNKNFSSTTAPLHILTYFQTCFCWNDAAEVKTLKEKLTSDPVLTIPDPKLRFIVEVDTSDMGIGRVPSQRSPQDHRLHPCTYLSGKLTLAERNYEVGNCELLAVKPLWRSGATG